MIRTPSIAEALASRAGTPGCWEWPHARNNRGYGVKVVKNRQKVVSRLAFEIAHRPLGPGEIVRHSCDNPPCFNPEHLLPGTHLDNMRDKRERGRYRAWNTDLTACRKGHEYTPENTYNARRPDGGITRQCRTCKRAHGRRSDAKRRGKR